MKDKIGSLLPLIQSGKISKAEAEKLIDDIREAIKKDPSKGAELGQLIGVVNKALKTQLEATGVTWLPVGNGELAIGHKPGGKTSLAGLKNEGATAVLTLLNDNEGAQLIGNATEKAGLTWIWFPFSASKPHQGDDLIHVLKLYDQLQALLNAGGKIYIHCSAGIHRTGMVSYGLLRYLGHQESDALQMLHNLREVTAAQVGDDRLTWGDQFATERH